MQNAAGNSPDVGPAGFGNELGRCLVDGDSGTESNARRRCQKTFGASLAIEFLLLGALVVTPLLSVAKPLVTHVSPPPMAFFGKWHQYHSQPEQPSASSTPAHNPVILNPVTPIAPPVPVPSASTPDTGETSRIIFDAWPSGEAGPPGIESGPPVIVEPPRIEQPAAQPPKRPVKVSEGVLAAQLISRIEPRYPPLAVQTRREGTVLLHAIISRDGRITSLDVISGDPLLVQAALDAVRQWRYRPTMLNGEPVEVDTSITVIFHLHQ